MTRRELATGPISWMARNPVAANLLMLALIVGGVIMSLRIRQEVFPSMELDMIMVSVPYPGASPEEVEQGIILSIEEAVHTLDGIKEIRSKALEGAALVTIELETSANKNKVLSDVKNHIDRITTFPEEAERPIVSAPDLKREAIWLVLYGDQSDKVLFELGEQVRDDLLTHPDISYIELDGVLPLEIGVEVPQDTLRTYNLTIPGIASKIRQTALELPAGAVKTRGGEVMLRTAERRDMGMEFADIPIVVDENGNALTLGDIAEIEDGFMEFDLHAKFEDKPCVILKVFSVGEQSPTDVAVATKDMVAKLENSLPPGISATTWADRSKLYDQRLDLMLRNAAIGLVLVLVILGLFLEPRLAFWVTMGIPISFMGSFLFLPAMGISLNMLSMFAFIVTLGMVVDDAIVVGENAFRLRREGMPPLKAAITGTKQMAMPVFFSIATTVTAFSPLLFVPGIRGKIMYAIPVVAISVLVLSLIESFFILPSHLAHVSAEELKPRLLERLRKPLIGVDGKGAAAALDILTGVILLPLVLLGRFFTLLLYLLMLVQIPFSEAVERFIANWYAPVLRAALRQRWNTLAVGVAILAVSFGLMKGGWVKNIDFPKEESEWVFVDASLPFGTPVEKTEELTSRLIRAAQEVIDENGGKRISLGIFSILGSANIRGSREEGTHVTTVGVTLVPSDERPIGSHDFAEAWRKKLGNVSGLETLQFDASTGHGESPPIDVRLTHRDPDVLEKAATDLAAYFSSIKGVTDVDDGIDLGKPQIDFTLSPEGIAAGLTTADLANQVRGAYYGTQALRQQRGRNEVKVMVKLPRAERETLAGVENLMIRTPAGGEMPLRRAANVQVGRAYTTIHRTDLKRTLAVKGQVVENEANAEEVVEEMLTSYLPTLKAKYPGLDLFKSGRQKDMQDFFEFLLVAYFMALLVMYTLIAVPLRSYLQPFFVVMMAIPFGVVGGILGHFLMGLDFSMISWMGLVALSGVVVNDSLVLVTAANRFRAEGMSAMKAGEMAARQRFRPIMLTSLTTFGGLMPMILETSVQAKVMVPMAVSLGFGVIFATFIILLIVPALFVMVETPRDWWRNRNRAIIEEEEKLLGEADAILAAEEGAR